MRRTRRPHPFPGGSSACVKPKPVARELCLVGVVCLVVAIIAGARALELIHQAREGLRTGASQAQRQLSPVQPNLGQLRTIESQSRRASPSVPPGG
jgi:hypothetical protein